MNRSIMTLGLLATLLSACGGADKPEQAAAQAAAQAQGEVPATSVRAVRVAAESVQPWIYGQGTARAVRREFLSFPTAGRVAYVDPKLKVGDKVRKGQVIAYQQPDRANAELANARAGVSGSRTDLSVAQASKQEALANLELARTTFERFRILLAKRSASPQEFEEAEARLASAKAAFAKADAQIQAIEAKGNASQAQLEQARVTVSESRIVSPINGVLARLNIEQGYYFSPSTVQASSEQGALSTVPVFIIDTSAFEVSVDLPAYAIDQLSVQSKVLMSPQDYTDPKGSRDSNAAAGSAPPPSGSSIEGRVHSITPSIDPEKRTFQVKARTTDAKARLRDGQFISIWVAGNQANAAMPVLPFDALRHNDGKAFVFVYDPARGQVARRAVTLGSRGRDTQAVLEGLKVGEWVVTEGRAGLADGDRVRLIGQQPAASGVR